MAIAKVQSTTGSTSSLTLTGVTAGNALFVITSYYRGSGTSAPSTPTDTNGTFSVAIAPTPPDAGAGTIGGAAIWYEQNAAAGTHTIGGLESNHNSTLVEFSGLATSGLLDVSTNNQSTATAHTSQDTGTTAATAQASELSIIGLCLVSATGSVNVGLTDPVTNYITLQLNNNDFSDIATQHAYQVLAATGTQTATFNWTDNLHPIEASQGVIATFKAVAGDVSVALTGQSETFSTGTLTPALSLPLTGQAAAFSAGTLTPQVSRALSGQTVTFAQGTLGPNLSIPLAGQSFAFSQGTLTPSSSTDVTATLVGQTVTFTPGSLTADLSVALTGQGFAFSQGSVSPASADSAASLAGKRATFAQGILTAVVQNFGRSSRHQRPWWYRSYDDELERIERERRERVRLGIITIPQSRRIKQSIETAQEDLEEAVLLAMNEQLQQSASIMKSVSDRIDKLVGRLHIERQRKEEQEREDDDEETILSLLPYIM